MASHRGGLCAQVRQQAGTSGVRGDGGVIFARGLQSCHAIAGCESGKLGADVRAAGFVSGQNGCSIDGLQSSRRGSDLISHGVLQRLCGGCHGLGLSRCGCGSCRLALGCSAGGHQGHGHIAKSAQVKLGGAGQHGGSGHHAIGKTRIDRLVGGVPMVIAISQQGQHFLFGFAGLACVAGAHGIGPSVQHVGGAAQLGAVATGIRPGRVNHHGGVFGHLDAITGHGNQAGNGCGQSIDHHGHAGLVALHGIVNGDAIGHSAANAVDAHRDGVGIQRVQLFDEAGGAHRLVIPPARADVAIDQNFSRCGCPLRGAGHRGHLANGVPLRLISGLCGLRHAGECTRQKLANWAVLRKI